MTGEGEVGGGELKLIDIYPELWSPPTFQPPLRFCVYACQLFYLHLPGVFIPLTLDYSLLNSLGAHGTPLMEDPLLPAFTP